MMNCANPCRLRAGLVFLFTVVHLSAASAASPSELTTIAERSAFTRTGRYDEVENLCAAFAARWPDKARCFEFGRSPEEAGVIMRVINEFQAYTEADLMRIVEAVLNQHPPRLGDALTHAMHVVAGEARTIEGRLARGDWIVGEAVSAADLMIYPCIRLLYRALMRPEAAELSARFLPAEVHYPGLARWMQRVEALPGFQRTTGVDPT